MKIELTLTPKEVTVLKIALLAYQYETDDDENSNIAENLYRVIEHQMGAKS